MFNFSHKKSTSKTIPRYYFKLIRKAEVQKLETTLCWQSCRKQALMHYWSTNSSSSTKGNITLFNKPLSTFTLNQAILLLEFTLKMHPNDMATHMHKIIHFFIIRDCKILGNT